MSTKLNSFHLFWFNNIEYQFLGAYATDNIVFDFETWIINDINSTKLKWHGEHALSTSSSTRLIILIIHLTILDMAEPHWWTCLPTSFAICEGGILCKMAFEPISRKPTPAGECWSPTLAHRTRTRELKTRNRVWWSKWLHRPADVQHIDDGNVTPANKSRLRMRFFDEIHGHALVSLSAICPYVETLYIRR